ncbi:MAG: gamma-glutamyl-gamma-aminobutyrate hydrolase family protein [Clostridia bacterium]
MKVAIIRDVCKANNDQLCTNQYVVAVTSQGAVADIIDYPLDESSAKEVYENYDAFVISGGADIDPALYGEERLYYVAGGEKRDELEKNLIPLLLSGDKPVLCICRGMQMSNILCGGSLYQDINKQIFNDDVLIEHNKEGLLHQVSILPDTKLGKYLSGTILVNSLHHQSVKTLGKGFVINAVSSDGVIEGIERDDNEFYLCVQWHPEKLVEQTAQQSLFKALIDHINK